MATCGKIVIISLYNSGADCYEPLQRLIKLKPQDSDPLFFLNYYYSDGGFKLPICQWILTTA
jgi:hypothetical protein